MDIKVIGLRMHEVHSVPKEKKPAATFATGILRTVGIFDVFKMIST